MNAFERKTQNEDMANLADKLVRVRQACQVVQAKIGELVTMRANWIALVAAGTYQQADVDALNAEADATALATLKTAVDTYLAS